MVIYTSNSEFLIECMRDAKEFEDFNVMKKHIIETLNCSGDMVSFDDIVIGPVDQTGDHRRGWKNIMHVCIKRYGKEDFMKRYGAPQCIGMCSTEYTPYDKEYWDSIKIY